MSCFWLVKAKKTSLLVAIFVLCAALLVSCSGGTDEGSKGSNKEEASKSDSKDRDSNEQVASSSDSKDQNRREGKASSEEVALGSGSENPDQRSGEGFNNKVEPPNYPNPPSADNPYYQGGLQPGYEFYHPDVDGDGVGSGVVVDYRIDQQPPGWVIADFNLRDNCPDTPNPDQEDSDTDGWGDSCDPEPFIPYNSNQQR